MSIAGGGKPRRNDTAEHGAKTTCATPGWAAETSSSVADENHAGQQGRQGAGGATPADYMYHWQAWKAWR